MCVCEDATWEEIDDAYRDSKLIVLEQSLSGSYQLVGCSCGRLFTFLNCGVGFEPDAEISQEEWDRRMEEQQDYVDEGDYINRYIAEYGQMPSGCLGGYYDD